VGDVRVVAAVALHPAEHFEEDGEDGVPARAVLLGPISFLLLGRPTVPGFEPLPELLDALLPVYRAVSTSGPLAPV